MKDKERVGPIDDVPVMSQIRHKNPVKHIDSTKIIKYHVGKSLVSIVKILVQIEILSSLDNFTASLNASSSSTKQPYNQSDNTLLRTQSKNVLLSNLQ